MVRTQGRTVAAVLVYFRACFTTFVACESRGPPGRFRAIEGWVAAFAGNATFWFAPTAALRGYAVNFSDAAEAMPISVIWVPSGNVMVVLPPEAVAAAMIAASMFEVTRLA